MKKIILITGSTDGIGKQVALDLAEMNHKVIIHGRDFGRCINSVNEIRSKTNNNDIDFVVADLSEKENVYNLIREIKERYDKIDVLINNAGIYNKVRMINKDNIELTFMVNYLSHFLLTIFLLENLAKSEDPRIINVSSIAHENYKPNFADLMLKEKYSGYFAYSQSKFAMILFTYALARRLNESNIKVFALHPGVISTKLLHQAFNITGDSLKKGAATPVYLATSDKLKSVKEGYFIDKEKVNSDKKTYDKALQEEMWKISCRLLDLKENEIDRMILEAKHINQKFSLLNKL